MADPISLLTIASIGASVAGGAATTVGAGMNAASQSAQYSFQAGIAQQNQAIGQQNAIYALNSGEINAASSGQASRTQIGQIRAAQGASGFNVDAGTATDVAAGQKLVANTEQTTIRSNAAKAAYDYETGAVQSGEQSQAYSSAATNAQTAGGIAMVGSFIGTAGSVAGKWTQGIQTGALPANPFTIGNQGGVGSSGPGDQGF